ncbi:MAG TPA: cysteine desulfurase family protein [Thermoanaerobaculia bacterium]|nr:cysteine desulfurase family protein [Thermoanaerobaculia bacterium]
MTRVYLDNNATTPLDPRVRAAMLRWLGERWGNPSSIHAHGQEAREAIEEGRARVAMLLGAAPQEIVFVASGTEANNAVLRSVARHDRGRGHLVISALEHPSIRATAGELEAFGMVVTVVAPEPSGLIDAGKVAAALRPDTRLVCLMLASNEIGTLQPVAEVARECRVAGVAVHCDAVQAAGKIRVDVAALGIDSLTIGAHKFHGPLGAAALWMRPELELAPLLLGGGQERRRRASTENVAAIVGFGEAALHAAAELDARHRHLSSMRDRFETGVRAIDDVRVHCQGSPRLPNTSHLAVAGVEGEALTIRLDLAGFAVSTGSACASGTVEPSPTLLAMGLSAEEALSSLRVSFGMTNTMAEVDSFLTSLAEEVSALRRLAPPVLAHPRLGRGGLR